MLENLQLFGGQRVAAGVAEDLQIRGSQSAKLAGSRPLETLGGANLRRTLTPQILEASLLKVNMCGSLTP